MELNCRVCLQIGNVMISVFEQVEKYEMSLCHLLQIFGGLDIDRNDEFPKYLCELCTKELLNSAEFRRKCKKSQELLIKMKYKETKTDDFLISPTNNFVDEANFEFEQKNLLWEESEKIVGDASPELDPKNLSWEIKELENELLACDESTENVQQKQTYYCNKCKSIFSDCELLRNHACFTNSKHVNSSIVNGKAVNLPRKFVCEFCSKKLHSEISLKLHLSTHTGVRRYQCNICKNTFKTSAGLITHRNNHKIQTDGSV